MKNYTNITGNNHRVSIYETHIEGRSHNADMKNISSKCSPKDTHVEGYGNLIDSITQEQLNFTHVEGRFNIVKNAKVSHISGKNNIINDDIRKNNLSYIYIKNSDHILDSISSSHINIMGYKNILTKNNNDFICIGGSENIIKSESVINNFTFGDKNEINITNSNNSLILGSEHDLVGNGSDVAITGINNDINGSWDNVSVNGTDNKLNGNLNNTHVSGSKNYIDGNVNSTFVFGYDNTLSGDIENTYIEGGNHILNNSNHVAVFGEGNKINNNNNRIVMGFYNKETENNAIKWEIGNGTKSERNNVLSLDDAGNLSFGAESFTTYIKNTNIDPSMTNFKKYIITNETDISLDMERIISYSINLNDQTQELNINIDNILENVPYIIYFESILNYLAVNFSQTIMFEDAIEYENINGFTLLKLLKVGNDIYGTYDKINGRQFTFSENSIISAWNAAFADVEILLGENISSYTTDITDEDNIINSVIIEDSKVKIVKNAWDGKSFYPITGTIEFNIKDEFNKECKQTLAFEVSIRDSIVTPYKLATGDIKDHYGYSVAISDSFIVIGAPKYKNNNNNKETGAVYVYELDGTFKYKIVPSDGKSRDCFGCDVAISDNKIVVGSYKHEANNKADIGAVYIYDLDGSGEVKITPSDGNTRDYFGYSVAISDNKIVVGSYRYDIDSIQEDVGAVYIYDLDGSSEVKITPSDGDTKNYFGYSVAIGDNKIVVGSYRNNNTGTVYIYNLDGSGEVKIAPGDNKKNSLFGCDVAISDNKIVVGAHKNSMKGAVFIYNLDGSGEVKITASDSEMNDSFGYSVDINNNKIIVGAHKKDSNNIEKAGVVYVYELDDNSEYKMVASDPKSEYQFGCSVGINNNDTLIIGSYKNNADELSNGYIFNYNEEANTWLQQQEKVWLD